MFYAGVFNDLNLNDLDCWAVAKKFLQSYATCYLLSW